MKKTLFIGTLITLCSNSQLFANSDHKDIMINNGKLSIDKSEIILNVSYAGGCDTHHFGLEIEPCRETNPVSCDIKVLHATNDQCEAWITTDIKFPISQTFDSSYYSKGMMIFKGKNSQAAIRLPSLIEQPVVIKNARLSTDKKDILLNVNYSGGCGEHRFGLQIQTCRETHPVSCDVKLTHYSEDNCEAFIQSEISIPVDSYFQSSYDYYNNAFLNIFATSSTASVLLPGNIIP